jgi:hypothetical protein
MASFTISAKPGLMGIITRMANRATLRCASEYMILVAIYATHIIVPTDQGKHCPAVVKIDISPV